MKKVFKDLVAYIKLHDGKRPKINFRELYEKFPQFTFSPRENYGSYTNFGAANMIVSSDGVFECILKYQEYESGENLAYITNIRRLK
jgi:hypothetical protein